MHILSYPSFCQGQNNHFSTGLDWIEWEFNVLFSTLLATIGCVASWYSDHLDGTTKGGEMVIYIYIIASFPDANFSVTI